MKSSYVTGRGIVLCMSMLVAAVPSGRAAGGEKIEVRKVAELGDEVPGAEELSFTDFGSSLGDLVAPPHMDRQGSVSFHAFFDDAGRGVLRDVAGRMELVARNGDPAPGTVAVFDSFPFFVFNSPLLHDQPGGAMTFRGQVESDGPNPFGLWSDRSGKLGLLVLDD